MRNAVYGLIIVIGIVATVVAVRNFTGSSRPAGGMQMELVCGKCGATYQAPAAEHLTTPCPKCGAIEPASAVRFHCMKCKHEFIGYLAAPMPGSENVKPDPMRALPMRFKRPGDTEWVPSTDTERAKQIKAVTCPKCNADMRDLMLGDAPPPPKKK